MNFFVIGASHANGGEEFLCKGEIDLHNEEDQLGLCVATPESIVQEVIMSYRHKAKQLSLIADLTLQIMKLGI
jgi:hypothetical protein